MFIKIAFWTIIIVFTAALLVRAVLGSKKEKNGTGKQKSGQYKDPR